MAKKQVSEKQTSLIILGVLLIILLFVVIFTLRPKEKEQIQPIDDSAGEIVTDVVDEYEKADSINSKANIQVQIVE